MLILFEDIISFVLVVFAWFRLGDNMNIDRTTKRFFVGAGVLIAVMLILDQIWQVIFTVCTITAPVDRILNTITCIIYFLLTAVISVAPLQQMRKISCVRGIVNVLMLLFLAVIPIVNIWKPLIFYHSGGYMYYTKSFTWYLIIEYVIYVVMIRQCNPRFYSSPKERLSVTLSEGTV